MVNKKEGTLRGLVLAPLAFLVGGPVGAAASVAAGYAIGKTNAKQIMERRRKLEEERKNDFADDVKRYDEYKACQERVEEDCHGDWGWGMYCFDREKIRFGTLNRYWLDRADVTYCSYADYEGQIRYLELSFFQYPFEMQKHWGLTKTTSPKAIVPKVNLDNKRHIGKLIIYLPDGKTQTEENVINLNYNNFEKKYNEYENNEKISVEITIFKAPPDQYAILMKAKLETGEEKKYAITKIGIYEKKRVYVEEKKDWYSEEWVKKYM